MSPIRSRRGRMKDISLTASVTDEPSSSPVQPRLSAESQRTTGFSKGRAEWTGVRFYDNLSTTTRTPKWVGFSPCSRFFLFIMLLSSCSDFFLLIFIRIYAATSGQTSSPLPLFRGVRSEARGGRMKDISLTASVIDKLGRSPVGLRSCL